jgi:DNA primase catalytic core
MSNWDDYVDAVKQRMQILDVVQPDVPDLKKTGSCYKGTSPWRPAEKDPSLAVWEHTNTWRDFGQDLGGDPISWLMERHQIRFHEALAILADKYGIPKPDRTPENAARFEARLNVGRVLSALVAYYHNALPHKIRRDVLNAKYKFTDDTIDKYQIGWAPTELSVKGHDGKAYTYLRGQGYDHDAILACGAFITFKNGERKKGSVKDFFHDRLIFPYWKGGRCPFIIGRRVEPYSTDEPWELPKYKKLLTKSEKHPYISEAIENDIFYNEDCIIRPVDELLITEGVTDCISAMQAGIPCISPVTTRFRTKDLPKLRAAAAKAKRVIICNDAEESGAGQKGALDTMGKLFAGRVDVRYMDLPRPDGVDKIDLNEFCALHGDEAGDQIRELMVAAKRLPEFVLEQIPRDIAEAEVGKRIEPVIDLIVELPAIESSAYVNAINRRFKVGKNDIKRLIRDRRVLLANQKKKVDDEIRERLKGEVHEGAVNYFCRNIEGDIVNISSFLVKPTQRILIDGVEHLKVDIVTDKKKTIEGVTFSPTAWGGRRGFIAALARVSPDLQWTGTDDQVQGLLRICADADVPAYLGSTVIGWTDTEKGPRWIGPGLVLSPNGPVEDEDLSYVPTGNPLDTRIKYRVEPSEKVRAVVAEALDLMMRVNKPEVVLPLIGFFFTAPMRKKIIEIMGHSPVGWTWATQGAGKTSVNQQFWRMHGIVDIEPFSSTETEFSMLRMYSGTNGVPILQDEFKPGDMLKRQVNRILRMVRRVYSGESESRGRPDLSLSTFWLLAPIMIIGECRPDSDPAVLERILCTSPNKNTIELDPEAARAFAELRRCDLGAMTVPYLQFCLGRDVKADLIKARTVTDMFLNAVDGGADLPTRVVDNLVVMIYGLILYQEFGAAHGVDIADPDVEAAIKSQTEDFLEGDAGAKDAFDLFLEALSIYAQEGALKEDTHYTMLDGHLLVHLPSAYTVYQREIRKQGIEDSTNGLRALRRVAKEKQDRNSYIVDVSHRVKMESGYLRCCRINLDGVPEALDVEREAFPVTAQRSWGGPRFDGPQDDDD